jgi:DNA modification methylase
MKDDSVILLIGDPPWKDTTIREAYARECLRVLRPGGWLAINVGHHYLLDWGRILQDVGLTYRWIVTCINVLQPGDTVPSEGAMCAHVGKCSINTMNRQILLFQKGGVFKTYRILNDVLWTPKQYRNKPFHKWEQPVNEYYEIIRCLSRPGELVGDLTFGSGTAGVATALVSQDHGRRRFVGIELDPKMVRVAQSRIAEILKARESP